MKLNLAIVIALALCGGCIVVEKGAGPVSVEFNAFLGCGHTNGNAGGTNNDLSTAGDGVGMDMGADTASNLAVQARTAYDTSTGIGAASTAASAIAEALAKTNAAAKAVTP